MIESNTYKKTVTQKLSLHIHAGSTKYNKLSKSKQKEADEIFKKIKAEKELYVPKNSGKGKKGKKATKKTKKATKKAKKKTSSKSFLKSLFD